MEKNFKSKIKGKIAKEPIDEIGLNSGFNLSPNSYHVTVPKKRHNNTQYDSHMNINDYLHYELLDTDVDQELNVRNQTIIKTNNGMNGDAISLIKDMEPEKYKKKHEYVLAERKHQGLDQTQRIIEYTNKRTPKPKN